MAQIAPLADPLAGAPRPVDPLPDPARPRARRWPHARLGRVLAPFWHLGDHPPAQSTGAVPINALAPSDIGLLIVHYALLGAEDRKARFRSNLSFSALSHRYHTLDWGSFRFLGARVGQRLVAVAELAPLPDGIGPGRELALSVLGPWQHSGIGERLMQAAMRFVCTEERQPLVLFVRPDNKPMVRLARKLGGACQAENGDYSFVFPAA